MRKTTRATALRIAFAAVLLLAAWVSRTLYRDGLGYYHLAQIADGAERTEVREITFLSGHASYTLFGNAAKRIADAMWDSRGGSCAIADLNRKSILGASVEIYFADGTIGYSSIQIENHEILSFAVPTSASAFNQITELRFTPTRICDEPTLARELGELIELMQRTHRKGREIEAIK